MVPSPMRNPVIMQQINTMAEISEWMVDRLRRAGAMALAGQDGVLVERKGPQDLLTAVDTAIEDWLVNEIQTATPGWGIVAEESCDGSEAIGEGRWWVLDPLDGTVNFASGLPYFCISLALVEDGTPVIGVVFDPVHDEVFMAGRGGGARLNGTPIVAPSEPSGVPMIALSTGFFEWLEKTDARSRLPRLIESYPKIRNLGSQALHLCYVACGRLAAAASVEARIWDDAAGALIATEAGARYTGLNGRPVFPVKSTAGRLRSLAAGRRDHDQILALLSDGFQSLEDDL
jgi:myo-inositol-1(or 4)-monophosphatase